ncbi:WD40 repeat-containing protein SMU1 [Acrasis kona]|uniref:WD40 repeat-containing protein SMU1 n=1 Tax=Acrasis kona TaxID=1008807 RepID=A0AAW2YP97_9EUKA
MEEINVDAQDVIHLMLQFCKENKLKSTFKALQEETNTHLNIVDDKQLFIRNIMDGKWDIVLETISSMYLPHAKMIVLEMNELCEFEVAHSLLTTTTCMQIMKESEPERFLLIAYQGTNKQQRRAIIAQSLQNEVRVVPPSRLVTLLGKCVQKEGKDIFGLNTKVVQTAPSSITKEQHVSFQSLQSIKFSSKSHATSASFTNTGDNITTGSVDGFIEVWNVETGKLDKEKFTYQANDEIMMHDENDSVNCICFDRSDHTSTMMMASGSKQGHIKVWKTSTGDCIRNINHAHHSSVTCICFGVFQQNVVVMSGDLQGSVRVHGLNTGKQIKQFVGHESFIQAVCFGKEKDQVRAISASSDGTVRIWDMRTMTLVRSIIPGHSSTAQFTASTSWLPAVRHMSVIQLKNQTRLLICSGGAHRTAYVYDILGGKPIQTLTGSDGLTDSEQQDKKDFIFCVNSPSGQYAYFVDESNQLYCFDLCDGKMVCKSVEPVHEKNVLGMIHHPVKNMLATFSVDGTLKMWV